MINLHSRFHPALAPVACAFVLAPTLAWSALDPTDAAKVKEIDGKVDAQLNELNDTNLAMDAVIDAAELSDAEVDVFLGLNAAQLRLDIEQTLLKTCARHCAHAPAPENAAACWKCTNPRLILREANGGYLEQVLDIVQDDLDAAATVGVQVDRDEVQALLDRAVAAMDLGDLDSSFSLSCQAFGELACSNGPSSNVNATPVRLKPATAPSAPAGFAGASQPTR